MKKIICVCLLSVLSLTTFAGEKNRKPAALEIPAHVKDLASKLKREVRTRISAYTVSADEANACSSEGQNYSIKIQVKKTVRAMDKQGNPTLKSVWETVREVDTDSEGLPMEVCME